MTRAAARGGPQGRGGRQGAPGHDAGGAEGGRARSARPVSRLGALGLRRVLTLLLTLALGLVLAPAAPAQVAVTDQHISGGGGPAIINHGGGTLLTGDVWNPTTIRNWIFDLDLGINDWPHGPQLLDAASMSSINRLSAATTPMSYYGFELAVFRDRTAYSLAHPGGMTHVPGARAIRGQEIMMWDAHMPWETPHDAAAWRGLGIYAHMPADGIGRRLGTGLEIGGSAGWDRALHIVAPDGTTRFLVDGAGDLHLYDGHALRRIVIDPDGRLRAE